MNITGPAPQSRENDRIDQANDRTGLCLSDALDRHRLITAVVITDQIEPETLGRFVEHPLRGFGFLEQFANFGLRRHLDDQRPVEKRDHLIHFDEIARVCHRNDEGGSLDGERHKVVAEHQINGRRAQQLHIQMSVFQVYELVPVALGQGPRVFGPVYFPARIIYRTDGLFLLHDALPGRGTLAREPGNQC